VINNIFKTLNILPQSFVYNLKKKKKICQKKLIYICLYFIQFDNFSFITYIIYILNSIKKSP